MKFQVPQFIGVEDKVFGPFTVKQFVYLAGGAGVCYIIYRFLPLFLAIILIAPVAALAISLAFVQVNGKPFVFTLEAALKYYIGTKLYLWRRDQTVAKKKAATENVDENSPINIAMPQLSDSKLKEITWALDINQNVINK
jgi:hypothetical protein